MDKSNWLLICFDMMCDYFPNSYTTREDKRMFMELAEHFCALENLIEHRLSYESIVFFNRTIGLGYSRNEMHEAALPYFQKALGLLSDNNRDAIPFEDIIKVYYCMADCYSQLDDYENAVNYSNLLIKYLADKTDCKNNYYFIALLYRAKIYRFYGERYYSLSIRDYEKALELESVILENYYDEHFVDVVAAHVGLTMVYAKAEKNGEAKKHLEYSCKMIEEGKLNKLSEEIAYIYYDIGYLYEKFNKPDTAIRYLESALKH